MEELFLQTNFKIKKYIYLKKDELLILKQSNEVKTLKKNIIKCDFI